VAKFRKHKHARSCFASHLSEPFACACVCLYACLCVLAYIQTHTHNHQPSTCTQIPTTTNTLTHSPAHTLTCTHAEVKCKSIAAITWSMPPADPTCVHVCVYVCVCVCVCVLCVRVRARIVCNYREDPVVNLDRDSVHAQERNQATATEMRESACA